MISFTLEEQNIFSHYHLPNLFGLTVLLIRQSFCMWVIDPVAWTKCRKLWSDTEYLRITYNACSKEQIGSLIQVCARIGMLLYILIAG